MPATSPSGAPLVGKYESQKCAFCGVIGGRDEDGEPGRLVDDMWASESELVLVRRSSGRTMFVSLFRVRRKVCLERWRERGHTRVASGRVGGGGRVEALDPFYKPCLDPVLILGSRF